jgi:hypothetical protein
MRALINPFIMTPHPRLIPRDLPPREFFTTTFSHPNPIAAAPCGENHRINHHFPRIHAPVVNNSSPFPDTPKPQHQRTQEHTALNPLPTAPIYSPRSPTTR